MSGINNQNEAGLKSSLELQLLAECATRLCKIIKCLITNIELFNTKIALVLEDLRIQVSELAYETETDQSNQPGGPNMVLVHGPWSII